MAEISPGGSVDQVRPRATRARRWPWVVLVVIAFGGFLASIVAVVSGGTDDWPPPTDHTIDQCEELIVLGVPNPTKPDGGPC